MFTFSLGLYKNHVNVTIKYNEYNSHKSSFYHTQSMHPTIQYLCSKCWMTGKSGTSPTNRKIGPTGWHCCCHLPENDPMIQLWCWLPLRVCYQHQPSHSFQLQWQYAPREENHHELWFLNLIEQKCIKR